MKYKLLLILLFSIFISNIAYSEECLEADKGFRNNSQGRGWFWGQKVCEPVNDNETSKIVEVETKTEQKEEWKILPKTANIPWGLLDVIDPDEVKDKIEPEARKVAIMYPTEDNIKAYRKLNKWMMAKSNIYTAKDLQIRTENPGIAPLQVTAQTSEYRRMYSDKLAMERRRGYLQEYRDKARVVVYTRAGCGYCTAQRPILESFSQKYGWEIMERSIEENPDEQIRFNVEYTPDIFLLLNSSQGVKYQRIATGLTTLQDLERQIIYGLEYLGEKVSYYEEVSRYEKD